jgi:guanylate kinase
MNKLEEEIQNDQELFSYFRDRNTTLCQDNFNFLMEHPEVKRLLNDYLSNILLHKPDDVFKFTKDYFKFLCEQGESHKLVILIGPNSVGKTTMVEHVIKEFPNDFVKPTFRSTIKNENGYKLMDIEEHSNGLKNNLFIYDRFDTENKENISLEKSEIENIQKEGKIAIVEIDIEGAKKMNSLDIEANFIGILPPSLDALRQRIKQHTKLNTEKINAELEKASDEIKEIEKYTFFMFRIINDELEAGLKDIKNAMISLYPKLKYTDEMIEEIKNFDVKKENEEEKKDTNDNQIKEDLREEIKEKEEEKSNESEKENK